MGNRASKVLTGVLVLGLAGLCLARREGLWTMELKHGGLEHVIVQTKSGLEVFYYLAYEVTNKSGEERSVTPQAKIVTETGQTLHAIPVPQVAKAVSEARGKNYLDTMEMSQEKIADGQSRYGVLVFRGLDDAADRLDVYIYGLSNEYKYQDEKARTGFLQKVYHMKLYRPGDEMDRQRDRVEIREKGWMWLSPEAK